MLVVLGQIVMQLMYGGRTAHPAVNGGRRVAPKRRPR